MPVPLKLGDIMGILIEHQAHKGEDVLIPGNVARKMLEGIELHLVENEALPRNTSAYLEGLTVAAMLREHKVKRGSIEVPGIPCSVRTFIRGEWGEVIVRYDGNLDVGNRLHVDGVQVMVSHTVVEVQSKKGIIDKTVWFRFPQKERNY